MSLDVAALTGKGNYYEDFIVGDVYEHARGKTMEVLENVLITNLVLNTAQLHFNEHLAETAAAQKHRIVFGGVTASLVVGLAMQDTGEQAVEEVGLDKVRFRISVIHGDTLYAFTEVVAKDDSPDVCRGHTNVGLVHFRHWGVNQRDETVFEGERRVLIKKQSFNTRGLEVGEEEATLAASGSAAKKSEPASQHARAVKQLPTTRKSVAPTKKSPPAKPAKTFAKPMKALAKSSPTANAKPVKAPAKKRR
jgi:itaconyl-CoA hydratase